MGGHTPFLGWSPTIPRMVTNQPMYGHPAEGSILQTRNLTLRLSSQNYAQVTTAMDGHPPSLRWLAPQPKDGHLPEGNIAWNLALTFISQN